MAGFKLAAKLGIDDAASPRRLIGIQAQTQTRDEIADLVLSTARTAAEKIGLEATDVTADDFETNGSFNDDAYGRLDETTLEGIKECARLEGILKDPVYTGKAITGLMHMARAEEFKGSEKVVRRR